MTEDEAKRLLESDSANNVLWALNRRAASAKLLLDFVDLNTNRQQISRMFCFKADEVRFLVAHWRMTNGGP